jgi:hypothetical protein
VHTNKQANEPHWRPPGELDAGDCTRPIGSWAHAAPRELRRPSDSEVARLVAGGSICAAQEVYSRPAPSAVNLCCRGGWRSPWRSAAATLNRQRGRGLAGNQAPRGGGSGRGSDRHRTQVRRHQHTQVTWSLPMGKRRHPLLCVTAEVMAGGGAVVPPGRVRWGSGASGPLAAGARLRSRYG